MIPLARPPPRAQCRAMQTFTSSPAPADHREFLSALPAETRAALTRKSDRAGLLHLIGHLAAIAVSSALILIRAPYWPMLVPVQGVLLVFLFTLEHECTHKTPFASERLNEVVGHVCGSVLILPFRWFRAFHFAHHRFTNLAGKDPELAAPKPDSPGAILWHVSGLPYWFSEIGLLFRLARGRVEEDFVPARQRPPVIREARLLCGLYALALLSLAVSPAVLWLWVLPMIVGQPALRLYLLAEHGDCPQVANMFENTRTTFTSTLVRFIAWNMPYHTEHHSYPAVPFHHLPALHVLMRDHLRVTSDGYTAFTREYLRRRVG